jgi:signal transduction histidine kinase
MLAFGRRCTSPQRTSSAPSISGSAASRARGRALRQYLTNPHAVLGPPGDSRSRRVSSRHRRYFESFRTTWCWPTRAGRVLFITDTASALPSRRLRAARSLLHPRPQRARQRDFVFDRGSDRRGIWSIPSSGRGPEVAAVLVAAPSLHRWLEASAALQHAGDRAPDPRRRRAAGLLGRGAQPAAAGRHGGRARGHHRRPQPAPAACGGAQRDEVAGSGCGQPMFERLERSFSALHRFTAEASHELKTP